MLTIHTYIALPFAAWPTRAAEHNYKLSTLNCKLISTPPPVRDIDITIYALTRRKI